MSTSMRGLNVSAPSYDSATGILLSPTGRELSHALRTLHPNERRDLEAQLGTAIFRELDSLATESDRKIFAEGMLQLGERRESASQNFKSTNGRWTMAGA